MIEIEYFAYFLPQSRILNKTKDKCLGDSTHHLCNTLHLLELWLLEVYIAGDISEIIQSSSDAKDKIFAKYF